MLDPIFNKDFTVPEHQLRSPNYPKTHSKVLGNLWITGGFCEPYGHSWKSPIEIIDKKGIRRSLPASPRNLGIDYVLEHKQVKCWYLGKVIKAGWEGGYGNRVHVKYDVKYNHGGIEYVVYGAYAHLASINVQKEQYVQQGDVLGVEGGTGGNYPSHVDYRQWIVMGGKVVDLSPNALEAQLFKNKILNQGLIAFNKDVPSRHNINTPLAIAGTAQSDVYQVSVYSVLGNVEYHFGKQIVRSGQWMINTRFNTSGNRLIVVEALDASGEVIDQIRTTINLIDEPIVDGSIKIKKDRIVTQYWGWKVSLKGEINLRGITKVLLKSPWHNIDYLLDEIPVKMTENDYDFQVDLDFFQGGDRRIVAEGYDSANILIASHYIDIKLESLNTDEFDHIVGIENTSYLFRKEVVALCDRLGIKSEWLLACMSFESAGTFSPSVQNPYTKATGLIQIMPSTAKGLGTSIEHLKGLTAIAQLEWVEKYFQPYKGRMKTLEDVYMAILWPAAIGKGSNYVLFRQGSVTYHQNRGLDVNGDGKVTVGDATRKIHARIKTR